MNWTQDWTREYPGQEEILRYLVKVAQEYNLYQHVRFNTTVEDAEWDDEAKKWRIKVTTAKGSKDAEYNPEYTISSDFLVSAVGQLNQPRWPDVKGIVVPTTDADFAGMCKALDVEGWDDPRVRTVGERRKHRDVLEPIMDMCYAMAANLTQARRSAWGN